MNYPVIKLREKKDVPVRAGHPWVFSNAMEYEPSPTPNPGSLVEVKAADGESLGVGTYNAQTSIRIRILDRHASAVIDAAWFSARFKKLDTWKRSHLPEQTDGYRIVHAESDGIPGLIVDRYADVIVFQIHTAGMERLRDEIMAALDETFAPRAIVERSDLEVRTREGLLSLEPIIRKGAIDGMVQFKEDGLTFLADVMHGQKTGFFLDQRDTRRRVRALAKDKRVLNLFSYSSAFGVHALAGGASFVASVDISNPALQLAEKQFEANGVNIHDERKVAFLEGDAVDMVRDTELPNGPYDLIVCDPPAFAKTETQIERAIQAYSDLNKHCFQHLGVGGILVTSSCSGRLEMEEFRRIVRIAAGRAKREVRILETLGHSSDHAELISYPEGRYLKTMILEVTGILA
ncbi:class I SAM-dependent rRNA methyltransferase [Candidatus Uhrbacteria bacterium]|nr:class I SAM-dependent rRNA methyltransferase [Candidatus Uhrbacteria bacterium]